MNLGFRIATFAAFFVVINAVVGGAWGVILGLSMAFIGTVFLHSYVKERREKAGLGSEAEVQRTPPSAAELRLIDAHKTLNWARLCFLLMVMGFFFAGSPDTRYATYGTAGYVALFFAFHVLIGRAAVLAERSWVGYGLLPLLLPGLGGLVAFGVLRHKVPYPDQRSLPR